MENRPDPRAMQESHFKIGGNKQPFGTTVNQATYRPLHPSASQADKDAEKRIRSNHFELGEGNAIPGQYKSVTQSAHDFKGDAANIRSKLDTQRKEDLTASHFKVGGDKVRLRSTMQASFQNNGPSNTAFNEDKKRDLRNSHFVLGDPSTADYKTNHEIQFRPHAFKGYD